MTKLVFTVAACVVLFGCGDDNTSIESFMKNDQFRIETLKKCNKTPKRTVECDNASKAQNQITLGTKK